MISTYTGKQISMSGSSANEPTNILINVDGGKVTTAPLNNYIIERDAHVKWEDTDREVFGTVANKWAVRDADTSELVECCIPSMSEARTACADGVVTNVDRTEWND